MFRIEDLEGEDAKKQLANVTLDTTKHLKIWFSKNPNDALMITNELRLIRHRARGPDHELNLLVAQDILAKPAIEKLINFCKKYQITLHDTSSFTTQLTDDIDKKLIQIAHDEIHDAWGNMGAASDIWRWLLFPILKSMYSDLDCEIDFRGIPKHIQIVDFLIPFSCEYDKEDLQIKKFSNALIAISDPKNPIIAEMKKIILKAYTPPIKALDETVHDSVFKMRQHYYHKYSKTIAEKCCAQEIYARSGAIKKLLSLYLAEWSGVKPKRDWRHSSFYEYPLFDQISCANEKSWREKGMKKFKVKQAELIGNTLKCQGLWKEGLERRRIGQLHIAASNGRLEKVIQLIAQGENVHALNHQNESSLLLALKNKHLDVADYLLAHGAIFNSIDHEVYLLHESAIQNNNDALVDWIEKHTRANLYKILG